MKWHWTFTAGSYSHVVYGIQPCMTSSVAAGFTSIEARSAISSDISKHIEETEDACGTWKIGGELDAPCILLMFLVREIPTKICQCMSGCCECTLSHPSAHKTRFTALSVSISACRTAYEICRLHESNASSVFFLYLHAQPVEMCHWAQRGA